MPLEETVDSLEGISDEYRDLYVQQEDGKFQIDISGLKSAVQKERTLRKKAEKAAEKNLDDIPDVAEMTVELEKAQNTIKEMKISSKVRAAALEAGVAPDAVDDVLVLTKNIFVIEDDGGISVLDADGEPSGKSVEKFFKNDFRSSKPRYYANTGRSGSGAQQSFDGQPLSREGRIRKAIDNQDTQMLVNEKMSKINQ